MATSAAMDGVAAASLRSVLQRVQQAAERSGRAADQIRVVAVSKTKRVPVLREVYDAGHRCFGENYVQELVDKAPQLPDDIEWHFIGNLQSNKVKPLLAAVPNLEYVESVDDEKAFQQVSRSDFFNHGHVIGAATIDKPRFTGAISRETSCYQQLLFFLQSISNLSLFLLLKLVFANSLMIANHLDRAVANIGRKPLKVFVQVNTSGETSKSGVDPAGCVDLVKHVRNCQNLVFCGLMTIGMLDYTSTPENFKMLSNCRSEVCKELGISEEQCDLSMGMSADFEQAIEMGSTNVRIGSTIFGAREYPQKQNQ